MYKAILEQSPPFRPFMQEFALFAAIARWACKYQITRIIRPAFRERYNMIYMVRSGRFCELCMAIVASTTLSFNLISNVLGCKGSSRFSFLCSPLMIPCLSFNSMCFSIVFCSYKGVCSMPQVFSSIAPSHMLSISNPVFMLLSTQFVPMVYLILPLIRTPFFFMLLVTSCILFSMCIVIGFSLSALAFSTSRLESIRFGFVSIKKLMSCGKDLFTFGASLLSFRKCFSGVVCLQILFVALFAAVIQTIGIAFVSNKEFMGSGFVLFAVVALLELWGILRYSIAHGKAQLLFITPQDVTSIAGANTYLFMCLLYLKTAPQASLSRKNTSIVLGGAA